VWLAALLVLGGLFALRVIRPGLDAPAVVLEGFADEAHFRDEAAKAHEARNMARFGRWQLADADEYGFWRRQSPYWVYGEATWFRIFGTDVVSARAFVLVHVAMSLALLFWLALRHRGLPAAIASTTLLGASWAYLVYSRLALMEAVVIAWLVVATAGIAGIERRPEHAGRWIFVAVAGVLLACATKQTGLLVLPAFVPVLLVASRRHAPRRALLGVGVLIVVVAIGLLDPEYQRRLAFNARHFTDTVGDDAVLDNATRAFGSGLFGSQILLMFTVVAPLPLVLATLEIVRTCVPRWRDRVTLVDAWMIGWLVLALVANLASPHRAVRFQLVLIPPAAWLGGVFFARAWSIVPRRLLIRAGLVAALATSVAITLTRFASWVVDGRETSTELAEPLKRMIGDRHAVVVGELAAQAVFATDYWHFYVRPGQFNDDRDTILALGITHLVSRGRDDFVERTLRRRTPELLEGRTRLGTLRFREHDLTVWALR
jgi:4-amino-4-deoxy-L-arabinose transferase-like glycosyltransferase